MKQYSLNEYTDLRKNATILSKDRFGDKVLQLRDGSMLKLFRVKRVISSARFVPYAKRFKMNAEKLSMLDVPTVDIIETFSIPSIKRTAVLYRPLEGMTLRDYLKKNTITRQTAKKLGNFIAALHNKGIYFRSIHFGNILVLPDHHFGLIDVSDMRTKKRGLSTRLRIRNFCHVARYDLDQNLLVPEIQPFIQTYIEASQFPDHQAKKLKRKIMDIFNTIKITWTTPVAFFIYSFAWKVAIPMLRLNHRLAKGFNQRLLKQNTLMPADIWVQAASAGESYLAWELLKKFQTNRPVKFLMTSNTDQGMEILNRAISDIRPYEKDMSAYTAYFPFDNPKLMKKAIQTVRPKMIILLESEIWPGFLFEAKQFGCTVCMLNGRMTEKSLKRYMIWPSLWRTLKPDAILAISKEDARRFKKLFKLDQVDVMPNIKFDRIHLSTSDDPSANSLHQIVQTGASFVVLGSVRKEEEKDVEKIIFKLMNEQPHLVIALFPRHLSRINYWVKALNKHKIPWALRSQIDEPVSQGKVIVWDTFGELHAAYHMAKAVFVGGSLAPLGGQNFLEPLACGISPVIGPFWDNFSWVGPEIVTKKLVRIAHNWREVADILISDIATPPFRDTVQKDALQYFTDHQGGTNKACQLIHTYIN